MATNERDERRSHSDITALRQKRLDETGGADEIISLLFDEGSFAETLAFMGGRDGGFETVVTGYGAVEQRLCYAFIEDGSREGGAIGDGAAQKIVATVKLAAKNGAPIIAVFDSAGGFVKDGVKTLSAYSKITAALCEAKLKVPVIALVKGVCSGASAVMARISDVTVAVAGKDGAKVYVNPPFLCGKSDPLKNGSIDIAVGELSEAAQTIKKLLGYLPSEAGRYTIRETEQDDPNRDTPELEAIVSKSGYDVRDALKAIADGGVFTEFGAGYAPEVVTGFIRLYGISIAVAATNPAVKGGALSAAAITKAMRVINIAGRLGMSLLTVVDTVGGEISVQNENDGVADKLGQLYGAYVDSDNIKVTLVLGKAYGAAAQALGSKAAGVDYVIASDRAEIAVVDPDSAVQLLYADKIKKASDPVAERAALTSAYKADECSASVAAYAGVVDDVAEYSILRKKIISAFEMLSFGL